MEVFEPLITLLTLLTVLSVASERITNLIKLRQKDLAERPVEPAAQRARESRIALRSMLVGICLSVLMKADMFQILTHLDNPWKTLGWVQVYRDNWVRTSASASFGTALYALGGCTITGIALGFGSKFWHDILSTVYEVKRITQNKRLKPSPADSKPTEGE